MISILEDLYDHYYGRIQKGKIRRKAKSRIKDLRAQFEWFEQIYRDETLRSVMINEIQAQNKIMDMDYMKSLDIDVKERTVFQEWLKERNMIL